MKKYLSSVGTAQLLGEVNGHLEHIADVKTLTESSVSFTNDMEEVRAGEGANLYGRFSTNSDMQITLSDAMFDMKYIDLQMGKLGDEISGTGLQEESIVLKDKKAKLSHAVANIGNACGLNKKMFWYHKKGCISDKVVIKQKEFTKKVIEEDIKNDSISISSIKGNTAVFNQMAKAMNAENYEISDGGTVSFAEGIATIENGALSNTEKWKLISGHKYLLKCTTPVKTISLSGVLDAPGGQPWIHPVPVLDKSDSVSEIVTVGGSFDIKNVKVSFTATESKTVKSVMLIDLTKMFGVRNEPSSVSAFNSLFPNVYYEYNEGELISFTGNGLKTVGFNQWDEDWEVGSINTVTGENQSSTSIIRSKGYIDVLANTTYYFKIPEYAQTGTGSYRAVLYYYGKNKEYLTFGACDANSTFVTLADAHYMRFVLRDGYGTTYNNDICINISGNGSRNGEYEPYWENTLSLPVSDYFTDGMNSINNEDNNNVIYDELTPTKAIKRIGKKAINDLTIVFHEKDDGHPNGYFAISGATGKAKKDLNVKCSAYPTTAGYAKNKAIFGSTGSTTIYIVDEIYKDYDDQSTEAVTRLKASLGEYILYGLDDARIVETPIDPPLDLSYKAEKGAVEEVLSSSLSAPIILDYFSQNIVTDGSKQWTGVIIETDTDEIDMDGFTYADGSYVGFGDEICVRYFINSPQSRNLIMESQFIPNECVLLLRANLFSGDPNAPQMGHTCGNLIIKIPRFQFDGQFDLNMMMNSSTSMSLNGRALRIDGGDCDETGIYGEIVEVIEGSHWYDGLTEVIYDYETDKLFGEYSDRHISELSLNLPGLMYARLGDNHSPIAIVAYKNTKNEIKFLFTDIEENFHCIIARGNTVEGFKVLYGQEGEHKWQGTSGANGSVTLYYTKDMDKDETGYETSDPNLFPWATSDDSGTFKDQRESPQLPVVEFSTVSAGLINCTGGFFPSSSQKDTVLFFITI